MVEQIYKYTVFIIIIYNEINVRVYTFSLFSPVYYRTSIFHVGHITNFPTFCNSFVAILSIFLQPFRVWVWYHFGRNLLTWYVPADIYNKCLKWSNLQYGMQLQISVGVYVAVMTHFTSCRQLTGLQILATHFAADFSSWLCYWF